MAEKLQNILGADGGVTVKDLDKRLDELIEVLQLKPSRDGYYQTGWGRKTREGLKATIKGILGLR